ncbi:hypothetical protein K402DRAFT_30535 [Aulographum hederae CBS 113979]|uniref:Uncharacterized protein n=1 Tax=Aulographum hederae CBS 113979 TaxID=1176131 RepID=A0A6G1H582_9PEZI|nr:hypothetical protein K402DRAFT_30535 [Aulographum hederae CBS 113979]
MATNSNPVQPATSSGNINTASMVRYIPTSVYTHMTSFRPQLPPPNTLASTDKRYRQPPLQAPLFIQFMPSRAPLDNDALALVAFLKAPWDQLAFHKPADRPFPLKRQYLRRRWPSHINASGMLHHDSPLRTAYDAASTGLHEALWQWLCGAKFSDHYLHPTIYHFGAEGYLAPMLIPWRRDWDDVPTDGRGRWTDLPKKPQKAEPIDFGWRIGHGRLRTAAEKEAWFHETRKARGQQGPEGGQ